MIFLPNNPLGVINRINSNIISDHKNVHNPNLPFFLANGRAFYYHLFMPAMNDEVKAEKRKESNANNAKKLQETIDVRIIRLNKRFHTTIDNLLQNDPTDMLKEKVLGMLKETVVRKMKSDSTYKTITVALEESKKISNQLRNAK